MDIVNLKAFLFAKIINSSTNKSIRKLASFLTIPSIRGAFKHTSTCCFPRCLLLSFWRRTMGRCFEITLHDKSCPLSAGCNDQVSYTLRIDFMQMYVNIDPLHLTWMPKKQQLDAYETVTGLKWNHNGKITFVIVCSLLFVLYFFLLVSYLFFLVAVFVVVFTLILGLGAFQNTVKVICCL